MKKDLRPAYRKPRVSQIYGVVHQRCPAQRTTEMRIAEIVGLLASIDGAGGRQHRLGSSIRKPSTGAGISRPGLSNPGNAKRRLLGRGDDKKRVTSNSRKMRIDDEQC